MTWFDSPRHILESAHEIERKRKKERNRMTLVRSIEWRTDTHTQKACIYASRDILWTCIYVKKEKRRFASMHKLAIPVSAPNSCEATVRAFIVELCPFYSWWLDSLLKMTGDTRCPQLTIDLSSCPRVSCSFLLSFTLDRN